MIYVEKSSEINDHQAVFYLTQYEGESMRKNAKTFVHVDKFK